MKEKVIILFIILLLGSISFLAFIIHKEITIPRLPSSSGISCKNLKPKDTTPVIERIILPEGQTGSMVILSGCNLSGFEGDLFAIFERDDGKKVRIFDNISYSRYRDRRIQIMVDEPCEDGETIYGRYSGIPEACDYVELIPGIYDVYTEPWGVKSNVVQFRITSKMSGEVSSLLPKSLSKLVPGSIYKNLVFFSLTPLAILIIPGVFILAKIISLRLKKEERAQTVSSKLKSTLYLLISAFVFILAFYIIYF